MRTSKHILLALALLFGFSSAELALADDTAAPAAGSQAAPESKPKHERRLGKRLRKLGGRLHRKKAPAAGTTAPATGAQQ